MIIRRILTALLALTVLAGGLSMTTVALAEEMTEEDSAELAAAEGDDTEDIVVADPNAIYHEKTLADFTVDSPAIYRGRISDVIGEYSIYSDKRIKSTRVVRGLKNTPVDILYVGLVWVIVRYDGKIGYVKREYLTKEFEAVDPVNTAPFQVQKHQYIATVAKECYVRKTN